MKTLKQILKNKIFRVTALLIILLAPFTAHYRFIKIVGISMDPYFQDGEWAIARRTSSLGEGWSPKRFDVVIIESPEKGIIMNDSLVKRVVGLPGETLEIKEGKIHINGRLLEDSYAGGKILFYLVDDDANLLRYWSGPEAGSQVVRLVDEAKIVIPKNSIWIIGDNREESWYGVLPIKDIRGRVLY